MGEKRAEGRGEHAAAGPSCTFLGLRGTSGNSRFRFLKPAFLRMPSFQILKPAMSGWLHIPFVLCNQSLGPRGNQRKHYMRCEGDFNGT